MNDYHDLMNEYQELKNKNSEEILTLTNTKLRIKSFQEGIELFTNNILSIPNKINKTFTNFDKQTFILSQKLMNLKKTIESQLILPINLLLENADSIAKQNLEIFNDIKISLIQERQKFNKTKDDYFNFVNMNANHKYTNEDENVLYNAKKENYFQLYKYEINQMNTIINDNNFKYEKMYNDLWSWKEINKYKIKSFLLNFAKTIESIGNLFIEHAKRLFNDINEEKELDKSSLDSQKSKIKNPRFEKVELEDEKTEKNQNKIIDISNNDKSINNFITPIGSNSENIINEKKFDYDIIEEECNNDKKNKKNKKEKEKKKKKNSKKENDIENEVKNNLTFKPSSSSGFDDFEIVEITPFQKNYQEKNDKLMQDIINKLISEEEVQSNEISKLMNLLKEENLSTKKLYSYIFLTKLCELNDKKIIILKNKKNFIHLSNILNDISIKENKINILKAIIDLSQIITYKEWYLFNLLHKRNKYLSTKTFWSKIIMDTFINDLNKYSKKINKEQKINENSKIKEKKEETNSIYLLEFMQFSNQITNYKKFNHDQKVRLDKYAKDNINIILTNGIEGMCSFLVQKNIAIEVIEDFGKNFAFDSEKKRYYELLIDIYMNRNYVFNLKKLSLKDPKDEILAKICLISNTAKFLPKENLLNLLVIKKGITKEIKKNIFRNILSQNLSIDERVRIWGLMLDIKKIKTQYNYEEIRNKLLKLIENKELPTDSIIFKNLSIIELDVKRTFFLNKKETVKLQNILNNILISLIYSFKEVGYFQGMNYIAAFFMQIFDFNEAETFYYMLAIEKNTKFKELFENNLYMMTLFFKVFEKILKVNMPEIYHHEINNQVNTNYYMPPWFLTLFTFYAEKFNKENVPKFVVLVMENFFLNGWSAIFNAGYTIIKYLRDNILVMKADTLMNFMVNTFGKEEILKPENFETIKNKYIKNSFQINADLISKLIKISK